MVVYIVGSLSLSLSARPPTVVCKMEAQLEYVYTLHAQFFFPPRLAPIRMPNPRFINKI